MPGPQRSTRQRVVVAEALASADRFHSAQELHDELKRRGDSIGLTTVYRHLQALADSGVADVLRGDDGEARYRACSTDEHHHHLVCRQCGRSVEVSGPAVESWTAHVAREHGFRDVTHTLEIFGTCGGCAG